MRLKLSGGDLEPCIAQAPGKNLIKPLGVGRQCRVRKRWPVAFAAIPVQSKLRNHEQLAAGVDNRPIHFTLVVRKYAQGRDLICEDVRARIVILFADTDENAQARSDFSNDSFVHLHSGLSDSLNDGTHGNQIANFMVCPDCSATHRAVNYSKSRVNRDRDWWQAAGRC